VNWPARDELDVARKWSGTVPVQLDLAPPPAAGQHILDSGAYEIASNANGAAQLLVYRDTSISPRSLG
jgi:hypothetical protein